MSILSPLVCVWWFLIACFLLLHMIYYNVDRLPIFLRHLFMYGKARNKKPGQGNKSPEKSVLHSILNVPKSYFCHFYVTSSLWNTFLLGCLINSWFLGGTFPRWIIDLVTYLTYYPDDPTPHLSIILAFSLIVIQAARRNYESLFVSSYSKSEMHMVHYLLGLYYYLALGVSILSKAPNLTRGTFIQLNDIRINHVLGATLFFWATIHHHRAHKILADLRKGKNDRSHKIPCGDWFEYVSCPHYFAEILIYLAIQVVLGFDHTVWWAVFIFTLANQTAAGRFTHRWYRQTFSGYPRDRKAVIPWVL